MKANEVRKMTPEQLEGKLAALKKDLFLLRMPFRRRRLRMRFRLFFGVRLSRQCFLRPFPLLKVHIKQKPSINHALSSQILPLFLFTTSTCMKFFFLYLIQYPNCGNNP